MSKYNTLWDYVQKSGRPSLKLTFEEIQSITGLPIDHSFLSKKGAYGIRVSGWENIDERTDGSFQSDAIIAMYPEEAAISCFHSCAMD